MPTFSIRFNNQDDPDGRGGAVLAALGPVLPVRLSLADQHKKLRGNRKRYLEGQALIDTGATQTCVDIAAAKRMGLPVIDSARMSSATHADQEVPVYVGKLTLLGSPLEMNLHRALGATLSHISQDGGVIALLGRDLLSNAVLVYHGNEGFVSLSI